MQNSVCGIGCCQSDHVVSCLNPCKVFAQFFLMTQWKFKSKLHNTNINALI